ncbi:type II toxin-antitoxin system VapB family antitoxin [Brevundimonas sp.]|jgi:antitoxin VapB|uniref:type II toxin-antitoxin system VapB family antitoxin n=1 Tax=Brevundimonas sp. TaxID=1871086 RepID=UPI00184CB596|nr:type II toxin-antitoxin system VapB family antitoxin [Brevundimonas sp.]MBA4808570.1 type II toxin-antitoxin system VapB family antitoxin [Brevundimonas sp.]
MGLSIKRAETERKARAVAERMGVSLTEAIDIALDRTWKELTADEGAAERARRREALFAYLRTLPPGNGKSLQEIDDEMYGEGGEPI